MKLESILFSKTSARLRFRKANLTCFTLVKSMSKASIHRHTKMIRAEDLLEERTNGGG